MHPGREATGSSHSRLDCTRLQHRDSTAVTHAPSDMPSSSSQQDSETTKSPDIWQTHTQPGQHTLEDLSMFLTESDGSNAELNEGNTCRHEDFNAMSVNPHINSTDNCVSDAAQLSNLDEHASGCAQCSNADVFCSAAADNWRHQQSSWADGHASTVESAVSTDGHASSMGTNSPQHSSYSMLFPEDNCCQPKPGFQPCTIE